jgi:mannose-6-phosphate isomerase-like protein (cupin superfamily)
MKFSAQALLAQLPGPVTAKWPQGEPFMVALRHGTMTLELFAPRGDDHQTPHAQDELYIVWHGHAVLRLDGEAVPCEAGDALFVAAGRAHRFEQISADFQTWAVFYGPAGGETA